MIPSYQDGQSGYTLGWKMWLVAYFSNLTTRKLLQLSAFENCTNHVRSCKNYVKISKNLMFVTQMYHDYNQRLNYHGARQLRSYVVLLFVKGFISHKIQVTKNKIILTFCCRFFSVIFLYIFLLVFFRQ